MSRLWRAAVAAGAFLAGGVVAPGPALAAAPTGGVTSPTEGAVLTTPSPTITVKYTQPSSAAGAGTVDEVRVHLVALEGQELPAGSSVTEPGNGTDRIEFTWTAPVLPYNGRYQAVASATGSDALDTDGPETTQPSTRNFSLAVPPAAPTGLAVKGDTATQTVSVSWKRNSEPDMVGYVIERAPESGSFTTIDGGVVDVRTTAVTDTVPKPGDWRYRVIAVRRGANADEGVSSAPSAVKTASVAPPPTTTTTTTQGASGGGDGGQPGQTSTTTQAGGASGSTRPIARSGRVDLSEFEALLEANRRRGRSTPTTEPDPGFSEVLPFRSSTTTEQPSGPAPPQPLSLEDDLGDDGSSQRTSLAFLAGGLLAFVVCMQLVWIKGEVKRAEEADLEQLEAASEAGSPPDQHEPAAEPEEDVAKVPGTTDDEGDDRARGAASGVPSRSRHHRRAGGAAVRPGGGGRRRRHRSASVG